MIFSWKFISDIVAPAICVSWTIYIGVGALLGPLGYLALVDHERDLLSHKISVDKLRAKRDRLETRANLLNPASLDPDIVDEKVRSVLGYTRAGDIVILRKEFDLLVAEGRKSIQ